MPYYRRLRDLREDNDLTQSQLVEKLGMHKTTYTNYEQGKRDLPLSFAITIAKSTMFPLIILQGWQMSAESLMKIYNIGNWAYF